MNRAECEGCRHDGQGHCFFWGFASCEVKEQECLIAKKRNGSAETWGFVLAPPERGDS